MRIKLAYGKTGLEVDLPDRNTALVQPQFTPGLTDEDAALTTALRQPIGSKPVREIVKKSDSVAIVFSDLTRPQPRKPMLKALLGELAHVPPRQITLINGLGTHRENNPAELVEMLGSELVSRYHIVQHNAFDEDALADMGMTSFGNPLLVNRDYADADVKILTGFIEPHLFAGYSGGPKAVLPGITGITTTMANHNYQMIASSMATWGITDGNPLWQEMLEAALWTKPDFLFNVTLNREQRITGVFAGDMLQAHMAGTNHVRETAMAPVKQLFDIVITTNSGYPLDLNLYQGVKGISAAAQVVKPGGAIILAAECWDGIPEHGEFGALLKMAKSPAELLEIMSQPGFSRQDQWQAQVLAQVLLKAEVYVKNSYLSHEQLREAMVQPCDSVEETVSMLMKRYGQHASICVMPEGPMTIPYLAPNPA